MNSPHSLSLRSEEDLLALVPFTLGFVPEESVVLVTVGSGPSPFHARVDIPDEPPLLEEVCDHLVAAAVRNGAQAAFVVVYGDDHCQALDVHVALEERLHRAGVVVVDSLRADGTHWYPLGLDAGWNLDEGVPYDIATHPLTSHAVLQGQVTYGSRDELRDSLVAVDPTVVEEVGRALADLPPLPEERSRLLAEARWAQETVAVLLHGGVDAVSLCQESDLARLLRAVAHPDLRDLLWCGMTRDTSLAHVSLWREVVRRSPAAGVAPAAGLLGFSAWLAGNGALAWCAVDRALEADPDQSLARLVGDVLTSAMPPSAWRPIPPEVLTLHPG